MNFMRHQQGAAMSSLTGKCLQGLESYNLTPSCTKQASQFGADEVAAHREGLAYPQASMRLFGFAAGMCHDLQLECSAKDFQDQDAL